MATKAAVLHIGQLKKFKAEDAAWRCVTRFQLYRVHEYLKAEAVEDAKWSHGASCWPYEIFKSLKAGGPNVPLVGHVEYLGAWRLDVQRMLSGAMKPAVGPIGQLKHRRLKMLSGYVHLWIL